MSFFSATKISLHDAGMLLEKAVPSQYGVSRSPSSVICLTVYNEQLSEFISTLSSLLFSIRKAQMDHIDVARDTCIAIVIDGRDQADPEVIHFLQQAGLVDCQNSNRIENSFVFGEISLADLMPESQANAYDKQRNACAVCLKDKNYGKLHSHALFFSKLCRQLDPKYCFQIDVGTSVSEDAVGQILNYLEANEHIASAGSTIVTSPDSPDSNFLTDWQYMDFALQAAVNWPAEICSGHLSVLPGQFSALRWKALRGDSELECSVQEPHETASNDRLFQAVNSGEEELDCPLDRYLRGLNPETDLERIMFLAEDRIIGNEILLTDESWKLGFCSESVATTDACKDITELARQRRRWNNSSTLCKFWLFGRLGDYLHRENRSTMEKIHFSSAMVWQFLLVVHQLLAPAFAVSFYVVFAAAIATWFSAGELFLLCMLIGSGLCGAALSIPIIKKESLAKRFGFLTGLRTCCELLFCGLLVFSVLGALPSLSALLLFGPPAVGVLLAIFRFNRQWFALLTKSPTFYLLVNPLIQCALWCYSIARLQDVSWGTKGLTGKTAPEISQPKQYWGWVVLALWLALNGVIVFAAQRFQPVFFSGLDPFLEIRLIIDALTVALAISLQLRKGVSSQLSGIGLSDSPFTLKRDGRRV